jgi:hypothetical protein
MEPTPAVTCKSCARVWNSAAMAEGLALIGTCPRCGGELEFDPAIIAVERNAPPDAAADLAPHLVLGIPRR